MRARRRPRAPETLSRLSRCRAARANPASDRSVGSYGVLISRADLSRVRVAGDMLSRDQCRYAALDKAAHISDLRTAFEAAGCAAGDIQPGNAGAIVADSAGVFVDCDPAH